MKRHRILRNNPAIRALVEETRLHASDFIVPLFIVEGKDTIESIPSMPGYFRMTLDKTLNELKAITAEGLKSVLLFVKVPESKKDNIGTEAINPNGLMQTSIRAIKDQFPDLLVFSDIALDPYSSFGHDGIVKGETILNDETVSILAEMAVTHAAAGVDFVAPSDMMDGRIAAIRNRLEESSNSDVGILSYSAKFASTFYGPFRDALDSAPGFGDKKTYQLNPANIREAINETLTDVEEGADIVMVKPALPYLDVLRAIRERVNVPVAAYQVSGEYAMIKAAAEKGWLNHDLAVVESLTSIRRAGADCIATYFARDAVRILNL